MCSWQGCCIFGSGYGDSSGLGQGVHGGQGYVELEQHLLYRSVDFQYHGQESPV